MTAVLIRADAVLTGHDGILLHDAGVLIDGGTVVAVGPADRLRPRAATEIDGGRLVMPGMIDAHSHLRGLPLEAQGIEPAPLEAWICSLAAVTALPTRDDVLVASGELLETGVTTVQGMLHTFAAGGEYAALCHDAADAARAAGIRALLVAGFTDRAERAPEPPDGIWSAVPAVSHLLDVEGFVALVPLDDPDSHVRWAIGPVAAQWAGDPALRAIRDAAARRRVHTHLHESRLQRTWLRGSSPPLDRLDAAGLLGPHTSAAHAVHLTGVELDRVRASRAVLVHCPVSNRALSVGAAPVADWLRRGIPAALGIDSQGTGAPDIFAVMREALRTATEAGDPLSPADVLAMATTGGAAAVGDARLGRIEPGAAADLIALDLPVEADVAAQIEAIVHTADRDCVERVWVAGHQVVAAGRALADLAGPRQRLFDALEGDAPARAGRLDALRPVVDAVRREVHRTAIRAQLWARGTASLGEAPCLMPDGRLRWSDLLAGTVLERGGDGQARVVHAFPGETLSALLPLDDGRTAVALRRRIVVLDAGRIVGELGVELPDGLRYSDGVAGPSGHLWIGVVADEGCAGTGSLLRIGSDGVTTARDGIGFANGIGFSADGTRLFHVDSEAGMITAIEHDPATGAIGAARVLHRHTGPGALDGLAVDAHDRLWVAVFGGARVVRVETAGACAGTVTAEVEVPATRVSSCCFGADEELYVTTARIDATAEELAAEPLAGSVFRARVGCSGGPRHEGKLAS
ncbi:MAG: SMP-30/gluconolactonase/LRE family protein [Microbacterium sp.]